MPISGPTRMLIGSGRFTSGDAEVTRSLVENLV
jgi:hypothetical protein